MANLPVPVTSTSRVCAEQVGGTGGNVVPGSRIPILTVKVVDYGGKTHAEAEDDVYRTWRERCPGALIQVVHGDRWEVLL